ncbi:hypothetical protein [Riemerella columbipharyngis]|uniref:Outer membrane transport energization protein TonB n=1 Tax=Riemerella columbipharyngis TaxID=1071918 RepID=A0A1G7AB66_9FLAO|nr:hypothetical protein [Riemerella columbipharyngis]SDE12198.1 hypothetical protein SAMN05421544_103116 [Riemerella columbipharyngis]
MNYAVEHKSAENKDRIKSVVLTLLISFLLFLILYYYQFTRDIPKEEVISTMLINFGDNQNGSGEEEPKPQEGSQASSEAIIEPKEEVKPTAPEVVKPEPAPSKPKAQPEKQVPLKTPVVTGNNPKHKTSKADDTKKESSVKKETKSSAKAKTSSKNTASDSKTTGAKSDKAKPKAASKDFTSKNGTGDGRGNAAIGNLLKGKGETKGGQGTGKSDGNAGDPLGGRGNGDSKIGVDRKLLKFIPGTMGKGGAQPNHQCKASGTISILYTVDKAGNVVSAHRIGGVSDPCIVSTSVGWVKYYVKAEKANTFSKGVYQITF